MSQMRAGPQLARWLVGLFASAVLVGSSAGLALGGVGDSTGITVDTSGGLSVVATGTWFWSENLTETPMSYLGWALDWGDVTSGNQVPKPGGGAYHVGDGTAATNLVHQKEATGGKRVVWVLKDGTAASVAVVAGVTDGRRTAILEGDLKPGEAVIVDTAAVKK